MRSVLGTTGAGRMVAPVTAYVEHERRLARRQAEQRKAELVVAEGAIAVCIDATCTDAASSHGHTD